MRFAAIDWGQERHRVVVMDAEGQVLERDWIGANGWELPHLDTLVVGREPIEDVHVTLELHDSLLLDRLLRLGVHVYGLNPKAAQRARERFTPSGVKDDDRDAWCMAEFLRTSHMHLRTIRQDSPATLALREWVSWREDLTQERKVHLQQLQAHLARWHPHVLSLTDHINQKWVLDLLEKYPTADDFVTPHSRMIKWTQGRHLQLLARHRIADAATIKSPTVQPCRNPAHAAEVRHRVSAIRALNQRLEEVDEELNKLIANHPDAAIFQSLPNAGTVTVATLLAGFGEDRDRWRSYEELAARWGVAPITVKSGKFQAVRRRQACDGTLHQAWLWFAFNTIRKDGCWAQQDYRAKRTAGVPHYTALRGIAHRWLKIATRCWKDRTVYQEEVHQTQREQRSKPRMDK